MFARNDKPLERQRQRSTACGGQELAATLMLLEDGFEWLASGGQLTTSNDGGELEDQRQHSCKSRIANDDLL